MREGERGQVANVWLSSFILLVCLVFEVVINIKLISTVTCSHYYNMTITIVSLHFNKLMSLSLLYDINVNTVEHGLPSTGSTQQTPILCDITFIGSLHSTGALNDGERERRKRGGEKGRK